MVVLPGIHTTDLCPGMPTSVLIWLPRSNMVSMSYPRRTKRGCANKTSQLSSKRTLFPASVVTRGVGDSFPDIRHQQTSLGFHFSCFQCNCKGVARGCYWDDTIWIGQRLVERSIKRQNKEKREGDIKWNNRKKRQRTIKKNNKPSPSPIKRSPDRVRLARGSSV